MKIARFAAPLLLTVLIAGAPLSAQKQAEENEYTKMIREYTTDECFLTPYVDHLPLVAGIPSPLDVLGTIAGAPDVLHYSHEVHDYLRALAEASPRVKVISAGTSEEGREMILVMVSSEENLAELDRYKRINGLLADPRQLAEGEEDELIASAKPMYWATGAMHSPETGSPEMLMELVYRLAVEETEFVREIRDNLIFMATPVLDVDGRDKRVDLLKISQADEDAPVPSLLYWGKYVAHDNNRDALGLGLELSKMLMTNFLEFHPQVLHDLHESASHLYTSTGTGPYNAWVDPILIDEWHLLAYQEITEMTKMGVPGVWTHNFYDGWAPNYGFYAANGHNAIGRFYETQGAGNADTRRITARNSGREWYRPNPPLPTTMWSIRNNVNMQQSALLIALNYVGTHREKFMENFYLKSKRSIAKAREEGPAAYVISADEARPGMAAELLRLMQKQGIEVHKTVRDAQIGELAIPAGSHVLRMDQPYSRMADMLLDRGYYNINDPRPYDDTGWTLGPLYNVDVQRVEDEAVLDVFMTKVEGVVAVAGGVESLSHGETQAYIIDNKAESSMTTFRFEHADLSVSAAEKQFEQGGLSFHAGSFILRASDHDAGLEAELSAAGEKYGFTVYSVSEVPDVRTHAVSVPRVAVMHTWTSTQNEGWMRMALDSCDIPYDYISVHDVRDDADLRETYDVILFGPSRGGALSILNGLPMTGEPIPWKASEVAPNIGKQDQTDDMRGGLDLEGVLHLRNFVRAGGTLITIQASAALPVQFGLAAGVSIAETNDLRASGSVLQAEFSDADSPIRYGYGDQLGVYFRQSPVFRLGGGGRGFRGFRGGRGGGNRGTPEERLLRGDARPTGRGTVDDPDRVQGRSPDLAKPEEEAEGSGRGGRGRGGRGAGGGRNRARSILNFAKDHQQLLISGMLAGGDELAGTPAIVDAPLGDGHVVLFAINPMWRQSTQGSFALIFNTMLHFDHLDAGRKKRGERPEEAIGGGEGGGR